MHDSTLIPDLDNHGHRTRLENIRLVESVVRSRRAQHFIGDYVPGQASYNLGEYPSRAPYDPDGFDEKALANLAANGVRQIQLMEDWNDLLRLHGASRFSSPNEPGLRRFIDMAHAEGIRVLLYASSGYMQWGDPDLRPEWTRESYDDPSPDMQLVRVAHWRLVRCSPASAGWRAYVLEKTRRLLDEYDIDGLFNDWGYRSLAAQTMPPTPDEVLAWPETSEHDAAKEDLLAWIYAEVKSRGGTYKLHADFNDIPKSAMRLYDYLWVGENIGDINRMRLETRDHPPYVVPQFDYSVGELPSEDEQYAQTIPYLQFPQILAGRPFTGERASIPGVDYDSPEVDRVVRQWRDHQEFVSANPDGPHSYGPWDVGAASPDRAERHRFWLDQYRRMVVPGTRASIDVQSDVFHRTGAPAESVVSLFANTEVYAALANYGATTCSITSTWMLEDLATGHRSSRFDVEPGRLVLLRRVGDASPRSA